MKRVVLEIIVVFFVLSSFCFAQSLLDDFNRTDNATVGNGWTEDENGTTGAEINNNQLQLNANSISGQEWVYQDVQSQYETIFDNNTGDLTWYFNVRQSNTNPSGFNSGRYAVMFVLGASSSDYTLADGYGVAVGKQGGNFPLRLLRFDGGFNADNKITELIEAGDYGTDYLNIKVVFNPSSGIWTLYTESSETNFSNPTSVTTQVGTSVMDITHTDLDLIYLGAYYNHSNSGSANAYFDNIYLPGGGSSNTQVNFVSSVSTIDEDGGSQSVSVSISNPDPTNATSVDVVLTGGTATNGTDISTYITQTLTFPASSSANQSISITIIDDPDIEASENLVFELQNVTGGNNAFIGIPSQHTLTIVDNEVFELMISEVTHPSDDADAAYVELFNNENGTLDFSSQTWYLSRQEDGHPRKWDDIQLTGSVLAGELYLIANNQTSFFNAYGINPDISNVNIDGNGNDGYFLYYGGDHLTGTLVDAYGIVNQNGTGQAWEYTSGKAERNSGVNAPNASWINSEWTISSPVATTSLFPDDTNLPILLSSFTANGRDREVILKWITESEIDNSGFYLYRSENKDGIYNQLSDLIQGAGNSSSTIVYKYIDKTVFNGITYWYKLVDVDYTGIRTEHLVISALPHIASAEIGIVNGAELPKKFALKENYPNPFNPETIIGFDVPEGKKELVKVNLSVYNILGQKVVTLLDEVLEPNAYTVKWKGINKYGLAVPSGVYIYLLKSEQFINSRKMILVR